MTVKKTCPEMIWIIDDEREIALQYSEAIANTFVSVVFTNPRKLVDVYKRHKVEPFALLSDLNMPTMNGLHLVQELRDQGFGAHTLLISGNAERSHLSEALNLNIDGFLEKPVKPDAIQKKLFEFLVQKREKHTESELYKLQEDYRRLSYELLNQSFDYHAELEDHFFEIIHHIQDSEIKRSIIKNQINNLKITSEIEKKLSQLRKQIKEKQIKLG